MNAFDKRYNDLFAFTSICGWDGHSAQPVKATTRMNVYKVWLSYNLGERLHEIEVDSAGTMHIEVPCFHGLMTLSVDETGYGISIVDNGLVVMEYCERTF